MLSSCCSLEISRKMGVGVSRGQRSMCSAKRRFRHFLDFQISAAEAVLAAVAVVLLVWLLWPEERGPQFEHRTARQNSIEEGERRRVALKPVPSAERALDSLLSESERQTSTHDNQLGAAERLTQSERRRIAKPSELADRLKARSVQPGTKRAAHLAELGGSKAPISAEAALAGMSDRSKDDRDAGDDPGTRTSTSENDTSGKLAIERPTFSRGELKVEPLSEVDLSDLDTLIPPVPVAEVAASDLAISDQGDATSSTDVAPIIAERDPATSAADIRARPRDHAPTWLKNAVAATTPDDLPIIAIVIDDLGLNRRNTAALNKLASPLTLSFLPYAGRIESQAAAAQRSNHELMVHLPMEPIGTDRPGPDALTTKIDQTEFTARLIKNLGRFEGFVGVNNHMGSKLTADSLRMEVVMQELRKRDVLFLDSITSSRSVAGETAGRNGVPNTTRDIFLDNVNELDAIKRQLARVESVASEIGSAVAIGHPYDATIQALRDWLPNLEARGFALAPISAVVARRACKSGVLISDETCGLYLQARTQPEPSLAATDS